MISKIIQKEKERQESYLDEDTAFVYAENQLQAEIDSHKQSLINLKEYLEELIIEIPLHYCVTDDGNHAADIFNNIVKEDIKELTKLIEAYNV